MKISTYEQMLKDIAEADKVYNLCLLLCTSGVGSTVVVFDISTNVI